MDNTPDIIEMARREIAQRRRSELERAAHEQQPWLYAFLGVSLTLLAGVLFLPLGSLADRLHMVVHGVCAQAHYISIGPYTMPLCARNTGIYAGFLATLLYLIVLGRKRAAQFPKLPITLVLAFAILAMGVDGLNSMALDIGGYNLYPPQNTLRIASGLGMGIAIGTFMLAIFNLSLRYDARRDERVIGSWAELAGAFVVAFGLYALLLNSPVWLYYPLAIFSVIGIVGVLFMSNVFVVAMISGLENRVLQLRQLSRPATIGIALTAAELALLAGLRMWMEHSLGIM